MHSLTYIKDQGEADQANEDMGPGNASAVGLLVERTSRFTLLCHLPNKDATAYDQGKEMAAHAQLAARS